MNLVTWDPFREMESLLDRYGRSTRNTMLKHDNNSFENGDWMPTVDIVENDDAFTVKAELPGVEKKDVDISIENGVLTIKGEKKSKTEQKDEKVHRVECSYGSFVRSFTLPASVKTDKVDAKYKDGILNMTLPKSEKDTTKKIEVKVK